MGHNHNDGHKAVSKVLFQPNIGLDSDIRHAVVDLLNHILANESILTQKTRSAHWNIDGAGFFELHILFDSQYKQINDISDELAERTRIMGGSAIGSLQEALKLTSLEEHPGEVPGIIDLLADHETVIRYLRDDAKKCTEEFEDEGTFDLLVSIMRLHEKMAWTLRSYLEVESSQVENPLSAVIRLDDITPN